MANKRSWKDDLGVFNRYIRRRLGQLLMRKVKPHHIQALIDDLLSGSESTERRAVLSAGTVYQVIAFIKALFAWAFRRGDISINPAVQIRQLKLNHQRHVVYTGPELQAIGRELENAAPLVRLLFVLLLSLATRIGELLAATHDDVNESTCTIMLRHTKSGRPILQPMSAAAMLAYQELKILRRPGNDHLLPANRGDGPMSPPRKAFKKVLEAAGITERRTFHDARRSAASEAITSPGVALIDVSRALNHSSVRVTEQRYLVIGEDRIRHALNQSSSSLNAQLNFHKQHRAIRAKAACLLLPSFRSSCISPYARFVISGGFVMP
jgi:integrase